MRLFILLALGCSIASAGEVFTALVSHNRGNYVVEVDALVEVPEPRVRELLTDYDHLDRLNPAVEISEILDSNGPRYFRVRTVTRACVWFFCKRIEQVQTVVHAVNGSITATVDPEHSDLRHGYARLDVWQEQGGTRVLIRSELEPDFWIPPIIGPWIVMRKLRSEALETVYNIERVANPEGLPYGTQRQDVSSTPVVLTDP